MSTPGGGWTGGHNPWAIALVVSLATFMEVLDTSIANVSLAHIAGDLSVTQEQGTWILTSYLISNAVVVPISGWLATRIGRKRFYMGCVALFVVSSFLSADASSTTVPIKLYSGVRTSPTPALNALATLLLLGSVIAVLLAWLVLRRMRRGDADTLGELGVTEV